MSVDCFETERLCICGIIACASFSLLSVILHCRPPIGDVEFKGIWRYGSGSFPEAGWLLTVSVEE
jgi:hypothetical protein